MHVNKCCNFWRRKDYHERSWGDFKYKDFIREIQRMWNLKTKAIPVITGANGTISKSLRQYLSNIPGKQEFEELQLDSAHKLWKVLM